jgi:hypothetical protein
MTAKITTLKNQTFLIMSLVVFALISATVAGFEVHRGGGVGEATESIWSIVFSMITALWANNDAKEKKTYRPFEYSYFLFLFWPIVLPYHLTKTRGAEGLVTFFGVVSLYLLPFVLGLCIWVYYLPAY